MEMRGHCAAVEGIPASLGIEKFSGRTHRTGHQSWLAALGGSLLWACLLALQAGCELQTETLSDAGENAASNAATAPPAERVPSVSTTSSQERPTAIDGESIYVAAYNIQVFGQAKLGDSQAMSVLSHVATRFDVMAIQEIRSKAQDVMPRFVEQINALGVHYEYLIGPRLGRTMSKEQYAFVYDAARIEPVGEPFTVPDEQDWLHREPFVARFRTRVPPGETPFTFVLINIHTDPDETDTEIDSLAAVFQYVQSLYPNEDDILLLGDLNVDEHDLGELGRIPGMVYLIGGQPTNTAMTKTYDNILLLRDKTAEFTGRSGVLPVASAYRLTAEAAADVSDHLPVWGEFSSREAPRGQVAERPSGVIR